MERGKKGKEQLKAIKITRLFRNWSNNTQRRLAAKELTARITKRLYSLTLDGGFRKWKLMFELIKEEALGQTQSEAVSDVAKLQSIVGELSDQAEDQKIRLN